MLTIKSQFYVIRCGLARKGQFVKVSQANNVVYRYVLFFFQERL